MAMPTPTFFQNYIQVVAAAEICLEKKLQMPALILIYTLIDSFAWAVYSDERSSRKRFEAWVKNWMLPHDSLNCEPSDLYAARCSVLHTMTAEASLTQSGHARRVAYAWGTASAANLHATLSAIGHKDVIAIHIGELFGAVRDGMANVVEKSEKDTALRAQLELAASKHFASMENETVDAFLARVHGG
jgi:hypothetical protein